MPEYHLYLFDQHGHIAARKDLHMIDDRQAVAQAKQFVDGRVIEVWSGTNLIARIDPQHGPFKKMMGESAIFDQEKGYEGSELSSA
jgi:hypothetical protein